MQNDLEAVMNQIQYDLLSYPEERRRTKVKRIIKKYLLRQNVQKPDCFFWPHAMMAQALMEYSIFSGKDSGLNVLEQYYDAWFAKERVIRYVDNVMNAYTLSGFNEKRPKEEYKKELERMAEYLLNSRKTKDGSILYRDGQKEIVYADTIGMACPYLFKYGIMSQNAEMSALAEKQIDNFWKYGMDTVSGLPYHGYHAVTGEKLGIIGWGRAVGWILMGISEGLKYTKGKQKENLLEKFQGLIDNVLKYQRQDGLFSWQLQALQGPTDISATGMILGALQLTINLGVMDATYTGCIRNGRKAMMENKNIFHHCLAECEGLGCYPQCYDVYPWGNAAGAIFLIRSKGK